jgi:hypothetical protein
LPRYDRMAQSFATDASVVAERRPHMNRSTIATAISWFAIAVLVAHGARGWAMQLRWVSAVIEFAAAGVIAWLWWLLRRSTPRV